MAKTKKGASFETFFPTFFRAANCSSHLKLTTDGHRYVNLKWFQVFKKVHTIGFGRIIGEDGEKEPFPAHLLSIKSPAKLKTRY